MQTRDMKAEAQSSVYSGFRGTPSPAFVILNMIGNMAISRTTWNL